MADEFRNPDALGSSVAFAVLGREVEYLRVRVAQERDVAAGLRTSLSNERYEREAKIREGTEAARARVAALEAEAKSAFDDFMRIGKERDREAEHCRTLGVEVERLQAELTVLRRVAETKPDVAASVEEPPTWFCAPCSCVVTRGKPCALCGASEGGKRSRGRK